MSVELSNLDNGTKSCQIFENLAKCVDTRKLIQTKIRKFFFTLHEKLIEKDLRVTISVISSNDRIEEPDNMLLELTNEANPIFLFLLCISKDDFETLRKDQGLNVEFKDFPEALVNLLDQCTDCENEGRLKLMLVDYYGTAVGGRVMDMNKIQVSFIEECAFKNICHLSLNVVRGTDLQIRQKLEIELNQVKQALLKKSKLYDETIIKVSELIKQVDERNNTVENLNRALNNVKIEKEEYCSKEQAQALKQEKAMREECDGKIAQERIRFQKQCSQMQSKIEMLEKELKLFHEKELEMRSLLHEKERDKELVEVELMSKKQEVTQLKSQNEKLDSDYHDKDKTVHILRTRLAVAEQELKDNNVLLLNHQNKFDAVVQEKNDLQKDSDFYKSKLEKSRGSRKALTDEIVKANEIISKQQSKINILSSKLKASELKALKLEHVIKSKEDDLCTKEELVNKLQEDLTECSKETNNLKEKKSCLEKIITKISNELNRKLKVITAMRETFEDRLAEFKSPQRSLLSYRPFLSMPTLLPTEYCRHTDDLWDFMVQDDTCDYGVLSSLDPSTKTFKSLKIIKPYILRYLKRFQSDPLSIFGFLDHSLTTILISPNGFHQFQDKHLHKARSCENINYLTEYGVYNKIIADSFSTFQTDIIDRVEENKAENAEQIEDLVCHRPDNSVCTTSRDKVYNRFKTAKFDKTTRHYKVPEEIAHRCPVVNRLVRTDDPCEDKSQQPYYAPVSALKLKPVERAIPSGFCSDKPSKKGKHQSKSTSSVRTMPAITAPPLTPQQRNCVDSVFKTYRTHCINKLIPVKKNLHQISTTLHPPLTSSTLMDVCDKNAVDYRNIKHIPSNCFTMENESDPLTYSIHPSNPILKKSNNMKIIPEMKELEGSFDIHEPSAYFAS